MNIKPNKNNIHKFTKALDLGLTRNSSPAENYTSRDFFEKERDRVFRQSWLYIGRENEVPELGSYFTQEIPTLQLSVIVIRSDDGIIRAFHNTCTHRGVALIPEGKGKEKTFQCPYHGWLFSNNGDLRAIPCKKDFPHIDKTNHGLPPLAIASWNGFLFVHPNSSPKQSLDDFLGEYGKVFDGVPFENYRYGFRLLMNIDCNWKSMVDAFNEGYHLSFLHKNTLKDQTATKENPFIHYHNPRFMGPHSVATLERNYDWQPEAPVQTFALSQMNASHIPDIVDGKIEKGIADHPGVNPSGVKNFSADNSNIFPNMQIQMMVNGYLTHQFWPIGPNKMLMDTRIYAKEKPSNFREKFSSVYIQVSARDVVTEDSSMSILQQKGLLSGGIKNVFFGENEPLLRNFANRLDERMKET